MTNYEDKIYFKSNFIPGIGIAMAGFEVKRETKEQHLAETQKKFIKNEQLAKEVIQSLPEDIPLSVTHRRDESSSEEINLRVSILSFEKNSIKYRLEGKNKPKESNYLGFCLETGLLVRGQDGEPVKNEEKIQDLIVRNS